MTMSKLKRTIILAFLLLTIELVFISMDLYPNNNLTAKFLDETKDLEPLLIENDFYIVSNHVEELMTFAREESIKYDELEELMDKYGVPYEYRDFTRQLCLIYNIDSFVFVSLVYQESMWGRCKDMNSYEEYRQYGEGYVDVGLTQLSSRYHDYFESVYFNSELLFSLGYVRSKFDATDPFINLQVGASYFSYLVKYCEGNYENALMSYNAGMGKVKRGIVPASTIVYTNRIMNKHEGDI